MKKWVLGIGCILVGTFLTLGGAHTLKGNLKWGQEALKGLIARTPAAPFLIKLKKRFLDEPPLEAPQPLGEKKDSQGNTVPTASVHGGFIENCAVLVPSCDKYHSVWHPFFTLLFKYWPDFHQPTYLITNTRTYDDPRVKVISIPDEVSWSDNLLRALEQIPEEYVLLILEDFMISSLVQVEKIQSYLNIMKKNDGIFLELDKGLFYQTSLVAPGLRVKERNERFRINCQCGIWKKEALKKLLVRHENPWEFEVYGTWRSSCTPCTVFGVSEKIHQPIFYSHAIVGGHWVPEVVETLRREGITLQTDLPIKPFSYKEDFVCVKPFPRFESFEVNPLA